MEEMYKIFLWVAVPFTIVFIIQSVLTFIGMGHYEMDPPETDGMLDMDSADGGSFPIFTVRNFIIFFTVFGWAGLAGIEMGFGKVAVIIFAIALGIIVMLIVSYIFFSISKLTESGNVDIKNAVNSTGTVYLKIPAKRTGAGKVQLVFQGAMRDVDAVSDENEDIPTGAMIKVTDIFNNMLVVKKI